MKLNHPQSARDPVPPGTHPEPVEAEIQRAAYYLWRGKDCPTGCDLDLWLEAKELLRHRGPRAATAAGHEPAVRSAKSSPSRAAAQASPAQSAVRLRESAHLDFRHSRPPFQPGKATHA